MPLTAQRQSRRHRLARAALGLGLVLGVAAGTHALALWVMPKVIMGAAMRSLSAATGGDNPGLPPLTDHTQRRIVMPSPDLLYGTCVWDVSQRPLHVHARLDGVPYASIAFYAANSDNFLVVNGRQQASGVSLWITGPSTPTAETPGTPRAPEGARVVKSPSDKGLLLMRVLVGDVQADLPRAEALRRTLRCDQA